MDDVLTSALRALPGSDIAAAAAVRERAADILRPSGALQRLDEVAVWLAGWQRTRRPRVERPAVAVFVADHGVTADGVSAYPAAVTAEMLRALRLGTATAAVMARELGASIEVVDVGVGRPTANLRVEAAMSEERFRECFEIGRETVRSLMCDLLVVGEMGIGNTTSAAAVSAALFGGPIEEWVGRGTGIDDETWRRKVAVVDEACRRVGEDCAPEEVLRQLGGAELGAMCGAFVEARHRSLPVLLDGFVTTAAAAVLEVAVPGALDHCLAGHCSGEPGHRMLLEKLGKEPLLDLGLRLGEGSGGLAALPLVRLAAASVINVATFAEWGISSRPRSG